MTWEQIINLVVWVIVILVVNWQRKKVALLDETVKSQKSLIEGMKSVVDTFRAPIELHEKIVKMVQEKAEYDIEAAVRKEQQKIRGAEDALKFFVDGYRDIARLSSKLLVLSAPISLSEEAVGEMQHPFSKQLMSETLNDIKQRRADELKNYPGWFGELLKNFGQPITEKANPFEVGKK